MDKLNIAVLFGGNSSEHEVSRVSAYYIIGAIPREKYNIYKIGITKSGKWFLYSGDDKNILDGSWENDPQNKVAFVSPDTSIKGLVVLDKDKFEILKLDAIFPALHGKNGEDGTVQGLANLAEIPIVGCDTLSSVECMDKVLTATMLVYNGINHSKFYWFNIYDFKSNPDKYIEEIEEAISSYPMFVKPSNSGSSVGISKVKSNDELLNAILFAGKQDDKIIVEEAIDGQEIECAVFGNCEPIASLPGEIIPSNEFYDYEDKYEKNMAKTNVSANLSSEVSKKVQEVSKKAYRILGCSGLARVDFFVERGTDKVYINEINTLPGFTPISMYPKMMNNIGYSLENLVDKLIELSINRE